MVVRRAFAISFLARHGRLAISFIAVMVLSRLLTPAEIGIFSVSAALIALGHAVRDFGIGEYIVQERDLTSARLRTAYGFSIVIAWVIAGVLFAASTPLALLYAEAGVGEVMRVLAFGFVIIPLGVPARAVLRRDMRFGVLAVAEVGSGSLQAATSVALAYNGFSYLSMAWGSVVGTVAAFLILALLRARHLAIRPTLSEWRRVASFGSYSSATTIIGQVGAAAPDLVMGRLLGFEAVALFSRALGPIRLFRNGIQGSLGKVLFPAFARRRRAEGDLGRDFLAATAMLCVFAWPFYGFLALMAFPILRILFGYQWDASVPLMQLLCISALLPSAGRLHLPREFCLVVILYGGSV